MRNTLKFIGLGLTAAALIAVNTRSIIEKFNFINEREKLRKPVNHMTYYGKEFISSTVKTYDGKPVHLPQNRNMIILAVNNAPQGKAQWLSSYLRSLPIDNK